MANPFDDLTVDSLDPSLRPSDDTGNLDTNPPVISDGDSDLQPVNPLLHLTADQIVNADAVPIPGYLPGTPDYGGNAPVEIPTGSFFGNVNATLSNSMNDTLGYGFPQLWHEFLYKTGLGGQEDERKASLIAQAMRKRRQAESAFNGEPGSSVGPALADLALTGGIPGGFIPQVLGQAGYGFTQPLSDESGSRFENALNYGKGAAISGAAFGLLPKALVQPFYAPMSEDVARLKASNIPLNTAQATGSKLSKMWQRYLVDNPFVGAGNFPEQIQAPAVTKAALAASRIPNAESASPEVMSRVRANAGTTMGRVYGNNPVSLYTGFGPREGSGVLTDEDLTQPIPERTPIITTQELFGRDKVPPSYGNPASPLSFNDALQTIWDKTSDEIDRVSGPEASAPIKNIITGLRAEARNSLVNANAQSQVIINKIRNAGERGDVDKVNDLRNQLDEVQTTAGSIPTNILKAAREKASDLYNRDPTTKHAAGLLGEVLDRALATQESNPGDVADLLRARQSYALLGPLSTAIMKGARQGHEDEISLPLLHQALTSAKNNESVVFGDENPVRQQLRDLAASGARVLPDKFPNSGTPLRLLSHLGTGLGVFEGARLMEHGGDPALLAALTGAGIALPTYARYAIYGKLPRLLANNPYVNAALEANMKVQAARGATK